MLPADGLSSELFFEKFRHDRYGIAAREAFPLNVHLLAGDVLVAEPRRAGILRNVFEGEVGRYAFDGHDGEGGAEGDCQ